MVDTLAGKQVEGIVERINKNTSVVKKVEYHSKPVAHGVNSGRSFSSKFSTYKTSVNKKGETKPVSGNVVLVGELSDNGEVNNVEVFRDDQELKPGTGTNKGSIVVDNKPIPLDQVSLLITRPVKRTNVYYDDRGVYAVKKEEVYNHQDILGKNVSKPEKTAFEKAVAEKNKQLEYEKRFVENSRQAFESKVQGILDYGKEHLTPGLTENDERFIKTTIVTVPDVPVSSYLELSGALKKLDLIPLSYREKGQALSTTKEVFVSAPLRVPKDVYEGITTSFDIKDNPEAGAKLLVNAGYLLLAARTLKEAKNPLRSFSDDVVESINSVRHEAKFGRTVFEVDDSYNFYGQSKVLVNRGVAEILPPEMRSQPVVPGTEAETFSRAGLTTEFSEIKNSGISPPELGGQAVKGRGELQTRIYNLPEVIVNEVERKIFRVKDVSGFETVIVTEPELVVERFSPVENSLVYPEGSPFIGESYVPKTPTSREILDYQADLPGQKELFEYSNKDVKGKSGETIAIEGVIHRFEPVENPVISIIDNAKQTRIAGFENPVEGVTMFTDEATGKNYVKIEVSEEVQKQQKLSIWNSKKAQVGITIEKPVSDLERMKTFVKKSVPDVKGSFDNNVEDVKSGIRVLANNLFGKDKNVDAVKEITIDNGEKVIFRQLPKNIEETVNKPSMRIIELESQGIREESLGKERSKSNARTESLSISATDVISSQREETVIEQLQSTAIRNQSLTRTNNRPFDVTNVIEASKPFFPFPSIPKERNSKQQNGFDVLVRKKGVFKKINIAPLYKEEALNLGRYSVQTSSSATFKIIRSGGRVGQHFRKKVDKNIFYRKGELFIEKKEKRINTPGELQEITFKGIASQKFKNIL